MSFRKSIRWRIQSWHGLLLLVMVTGFGMTTYRLERTNALLTLDEELRVRLSALTNALDRGGKGPPGGKRDGPPREEEGDRPPPPGDDPMHGPEGGPPQDSGHARFESAEIANLFGGSEKPSFYFIIWSRQGGVLVKSATAPPDAPMPPSPSSSSSSGNVRERGRLRESYVFTPPGESLLVGRSMVGVDKAMRGLAVKIAAMCAGLLSFGLATGWWIATRALRSIERISAAATRIADGHLDERIQTDETESELGKLAALLDHTFERLATAFEEQARFTSDAAHELRTPVSIILAQSQLALSRERDPAAYRESIEISRRAAMRMQELTESLLELAVLDDHSQRREVVPCDLAVIAHEQMELARPLVAEKGIVMTADLLTAPCLANAGQIGQLILNLLSNAVKFSKSNTVVNIKTKTEGDEVVISINDNGTGIAAEHLPHLFERFYRVEASRNRVTGGAGLGLAICKRIADAHGGTLAVESKPGLGSMFTLRLPVSGR